MLNHLWLLYSQPRYIYLKPSTSYIVKRNNQGFCLRFMTMTY